jgi:hypothetical protein
MTKDKPCPRIGDSVAEPRRLQGRREIDVWVAERRRVLGELQRREDPAPTLFDLGCAAA